MDPTNPKKLYEETSIPPLLQDPSYEQAKFVKNAVTRVVEIASEIPLNTGIGKTLVDIGTTVVQYVSETRRPTEEVRHHVQGFLAEAQPHLKRVAENMRAQPFPTEKTYQFTANKEQLKKCLEPQVGRYFIDPVVNEFAGSVPLFDLEIHHKVGFIIADKNLPAPPSQAAHINITDALKRCAEPS